MKYRLQSTGLIFTPGLLATMQNQYQNGDDNSKVYVVNVMAAGYGNLPIGLVLAYLKNQTTPQLEDDGQTLVLYWGEEEDDLPPRHHL